ncbi:hypothetical protein V8Z74_14975 [Comamonas sp. w2-DMI]|uniref:hypothetical protein n=1 Tax=Comamonas sp. w2-DMI TaxID=3126391 RepID=UPI0032E39F75
MQIRSRDVARLLTRTGTVQMVQEVPAVVVTVVERREFESARRNLNFGEVIVTRECTSNFAIADAIRVVPVQVKDVHIGKLHLKFYKELGKVKRNFVADDSQVRKLLGIKRERLALPIVDWIGDTSEEDIRKLAQEAVKEIENLCIKSPSVGKQSTKVDAKVAPVVVQVPSTPKAEKPVVFSKPSSSENVAEQPEPGPQQGSVNRAAVGMCHKGVVVEFGTIWRGGFGDTKARFKTFCLKLDIGGTHVPFYGVELERECSERGVQPGQTVEVIDMGRQHLPDNRHKNLYRINILKVK